MIYNFWISWWHEKDFSIFELDFPWWVSGDNEKGHKSICAAIKAINDYDVKDIVLQSYDTLPDHLEFRFNIKKENNWSPFCDRFPKRDWMKWHNKDLKK